MKKGSRSKKAVRRKMMLGTILCIAALCAGCGKKASEEAAQTQVPTTQETTTQAATSAPEILIQSDEEQKEETKDLPDYNLPEEREEKDGMIRSFLTGQMVPVEQANRRPIAIMMSNDKEARPQYGMNRAGVVYEAPVEAEMNRYMAVIEDYDDLDRIGSVRSVPIILILQESLMRSMPILARVPLQSLILIMWIISMVWMLLEILRITEARINILLTMPTQAETV